MLPKLDAGMAGLAGNDKATTGEIIADTYHTYNSIGNLAPISAQNENLSCVIKSKHSKMFRSKNPQSQV